MFIPFVSVWIIEHGEMDWKCAWAAKQNRLKLGWRCVLHDHRDKYYNIILHLWSYTSTLVLTAYGPEWCAFNPCSSLLTFQLTLFGDRSVLPSFAVPESGHCATRVSLFLDSSLAADDSVPILNPSNPIIHGVSNIQVLNQCLMFEVIQTGFEVVPTGPF